MRHRMLVAALTLVLPFAASLSAQQVTGVWQPTDPGNWNEGSNWDTFGFPDVPNGDFGDIAEISNGGTAIVDEEVSTVANLNITSGVVQIDDGGSLSAVEQLDPFVGGDLNIGGAGRLALSGDGSFTADFNGVNNGEISISGPDATLSFGGTFTNNGTIVADIVGGSHSAIQVAGTATLAGTLRPSFDATPAFGDAWTIVDAGSVVGGLGLDLTDAPALDAGLLYDTRTVGGSAELIVRNTLVATVDRVSGDVLLSNPAGATIDLTGFTLRSANGLLNPAGMQAAGDGFVGVSTANAMQSAQLAVDNMLSLPVGGSASIGAAYAAGPQTPSEEDLVLTYSTAAGDVFTGMVNYEGPKSDLVLNVDPDTGGAAISLLSPHFPASDVAGYTVESAAGSLLADYDAFQNSGVAGPNWQTIPTNSANHVGELNLQSSFEFSQGDVKPLGTLFSIGGEQDLVFTYALTNGDVRLGSVTYGALPDGPGCIAGDVDCNGVIDLVDFNTLKANFGKSPATREEGDLDESGTIDLVDFNELKANFGNTAPVPEPAAWSLAACAALAGLWLRRRAG